MGFFDKFKSIAALQTELEGLKKQETRLKEGVLSMGRTATDMEKEDGWKDSAPHKLQKSRVAGKEQELERVQARIKVVEALLRNKGA